MSYIFENQMIGVNIRRFRIKRRMTEMELAVKISKVRRKLTQNSIKSLERGIYRPSPHRVYYIAKALGVSMEELLQ